MKNTENNNGLKDEPELESRFDNIMNELQSMKSETKCGSCKEAFGEMIETGERYTKIQKITDKMATKGYHSWQEVPDGEKVEMQEAVGLATKAAVEVETPEKVVEDAKPTQQLNRTKFLKAFKFPARL